MSALSEQQNIQYVTHAEFQPFAEATKVALRDINSKLDQRSQVNWGMVSVFLAGLIAAGTLITSQINSSREMAVIRDANQAHEIDRITEAMALLSERIDDVHRRKVDWRAEQAFWNGMMQARVERNTLDLTVRVSGEDGSQNARLEQLEKTQDEISVEQRSRTPKVYGGDE